MFGKPDGFELRVSPDGATGVFNMGGTGVANYVTILEAVRRVRQ